MAEAPPKDLTHPGVREACASASRHCRRRGTCAHRTASKDRNCERPSMMSMPLKLSGGFSSKIGVFWTASSYGPGTPFVSLTLAFHGVGGYGWYFASLPIADDHVVGQHPPNRFSEAARDRVLRHLERLPRFRVTGADLGHRFLGEVERASR